jgi:hypothetical protein
MSTNNPTTLNDLTNATHTTIYGVPVTYTRDRIAIGIPDQAIERAFKAPMLPGFCDLIMHGYPDGEFAAFKYNSVDVRITQPQIAAIARFFYQEQMPPIRLVACWLGKSSASFAQKLARELQTVVLASTAEVYPHPEGQLQTRFGFWRLFEGVPMLPVPPEDM